MNTLSKAIIGALAFTGTITTATAAGVITHISGGGPGLGSFGVLNNSIVPKQLNLNKIFDSSDPITLTFTVAHAQGAGGPYRVTETIGNHTGLVWSDFHLSISGPTAGGQGMVFTNFNNSALTGFTLDSPPSSGPRNLNFTGNLGDAGTATVTFNLNLPDPGAGHTAIFTLTQLPSASPSVSPVPEPETYAMLMAGLGVIGLMVRRRSARQSV